MTGRGGGRGGFAKRSGGGGGGGAAKRPRHEERPPVTHVTLFGVELETGAVPAPEQLAAAAAAMRARPELAWLCENYCLHAHVQVDEISVERVQVVGPLAGLIVLGVTGSSGTEDPGLIRNCFSERVVFDIHKVLSGPVFDLLYGRSRQASRTKPLADLFYRLSWMRLSEQEELGVCELAENGMTVRLAVPELPRVVDAAVADHVKQVAAALTPDEGMLLVLTEPTGKPYFLGGRRALALAHSLTVSDPDVSRVLSALQCLAMQGGVVATAHGPLAALTADVGVLAAALGAQPLPCITIDLCLSMKN
jgi:hypothetical protein